jgi:uncharacterized protein (DUF58 family)
VETLAQAPRREGSVPGADGPVADPPSDAPSDARLPGAEPSGTRTRPTQQGRVYLWTLGAFTLFLLLWTQAQLAFLLGSLALGCAGACWLLARGNLRGLRFARQVPRTTRVGAPTPVRWTVRNLRRTAAMGIEVEDRPARGSHPVRLQIEFPVVPAGGTARCTASVRFGRRGVVELGHAPAQVASRVPLGLFRVAGSLAGGGRLLVRPREGRVSADLRSRLLGRRPASARRRLARGDDVIYGVREFRLGDDPRRIHWRTSARRGALTVSEWRGERGREAVIVLGRGAGAGGRAAADFERAVSAAASIWRACVRGGLHARLVLGHGRPRRADGSGRGLGAGLDALARVAPQGSRKPRTALRALGDEQGPRTVVYVSAGRERGLEADLAKAAGRGGQGVLVRAATPELARWVKGLRP